MEFDVNELKKILYKNGAAMVGFADLTEVGGSPDLPYGISIAVNFPAAVVKSIWIGPNEEYYRETNELNQKLNYLASIGAEYITNAGHKVFAQTTGAVNKIEPYRTTMPHKTVAVEAGLGWIGKSALFITDEYGAAVRLTSILTDAKVEPERRIQQTKCGDCMICRDACPGQAISGKLWTKETERDELLDPKACEEKAKELTFKRFGKAVTVCGKCIEVCPYTQKYIRSFEEWEE